MITLTDTNTDRCLNPVAGKYDCVEFCFESDNVIDNDPVALVIDICFTATAIPAGEGITFTNNNGNDFSILNNGLSVQDGYQFIEPQADATARRDAFIAAFQDNPYLSTYYTIATQGADCARITAKCTGTEFDFNATVTSGITTEITIIPVTAAEDLEELDDYNAFIQVWCDGEDKPAFELLLPPTIDGITLTAEIKANLARKLRSLVETPAPDCSQTGFVLHPEIFKQIYIRHGEYYRQNNLPYTGKLTQEDPFTILNAALQKTYTGDLSEFCVDPGEIQQFLTNMPLDSGLTVCCDACMFMYFYAPDDITGATMIANVTDKDGNTNFGIAILDLTTTDLGVYSVPVGPGNWPGTGVIAMTDDIVEYEFTAFFDTSGGVVDFDPVTFYIDRFDCCCKTFLFLNQWGGIDSISFNCDHKEEIDSKLTTYCEVVDCAGALHEGGTQPLKSDVSEVFEVSSKLHSTYQNKKWLKEFYGSPCKWTMVDGQLATVIPTSSKVTITERGDQNIYSGFSYRLNFNQEHQSK